MAGRRVFQITLNGKSPSGELVVDTEVFWHDDNALEIIKATPIAPIQDRADTTNDNSDGSVPSENRSDTRIQSG